MKKNIFYILILITLTACATGATPQRLPEVSPIETTHQPNEKILLVNGANYYLTNPDGSEQILLYVNADNQLGMASLSPEKTKFAYFLNNVVYIQDIATGKTTALSKEDIGQAGGDQIRWSPDGAKLALSCSIERQPWFGICLIDTQSGEIEVLLNEKNTDKFCSESIDNTIGLMDWSKDGSTLVYDCSRLLAQGQKPEFVVYLYDFASKTSRKIFDARTQDTIWGMRSVSVSPDNKLLLISGDHKDHLGQVFLLDLSNNVIKQLTHETDYDSSALVWRSDSKSFYLNKISMQIPYPESNFIMNINGEILSSLEIEGTIIK